MIYRRKRRDDLWHWKTSCPEWPETDFVEIDADEPSDGFGCGLCVVLPEVGFFQEGAKGCMKILDTDNDTRQELIHHPERRKN